LVRGIPLTRLLRKRKREAADCVVLKDDFVIRFNALKEIFPGLDSVGQLANKGNGTFFTGSELVLSVWFKSLGRVVSRAISRENETRGAKLANVLF
jgi:hypothetical protein